MPPTLYHVPRTISSPLVQLILELDLIDQGAIVVQEMSFADLKKPEHLAINTMGTSPAFQCTQMGLCMWESGAILDYLLERHDTDYQFHPPPTTPTSTPDEIRLRTKYLQLKQFIIATVYPFIASMYIHALTHGQNLDEEYMAAAKQKCHACMGPALATALGDKPYFLGDNISVIDLLAAKPLGNAHALGLIAEEAPTLVDLLERIQARPTYRMAYEGLAKRHEQALAESVVEVEEPNDQELVLVPKKKRNPKQAKEATLKKKRFSWALRGRSSSIENEVEC
ncbi:S-transferase-like protein [Seminavis robusta]|uniref:S-transferase-like protein n=1 Tax=Seminavis robusta TaxID=568900 RepID=A0A9N8HC09_9STRA|nr:S-transferase-like protein [Seminavis robusta]|eukprot:Sro387_g132170.1 S-transferase-like protein (282) ;mRNA; f:54048-54893